MLGLQIGLRPFDTDTIQWFQATVRQPDATRAQLARGWCERENWRNASGALCASSARKLLPRLAERLGVALPSVPDVHVDTSLEGCGEVSLQVVSHAQQRRQFRALMASHHPQGEPHHPGKQLCWLIHAEHFGVIGGIGFCAASWHQRARDQSIGWTRRARVANLGLVVNYHRFLLLPQAWEQAHGERPVLVYTYVSPDYAGTSYAAAGWVEVGHTSGRSPSGASGIQRAVWVKPLAEDWQPRLCAEPRPVLGQMGRLHLQGDWAAREFGRGTHPDGRVRARIERMGRSWEHKLGQPFR